MIDIVRITKKPRRIFRHHSAKIAINRRLNRTMPSISAVLAMAFYSVLLCVFFLSTPNPAKAQDAQDTPVQASKGGYAFSNYAPVAPIESPREVIVETEYYYITLSEEEGTFKDIRFKEYPLKYSEQTDFPKEAHQWIYSAERMISKDFWQLMDSLEPHIGGYKGYESPIKQSTKFITSQNPIRPFQLLFLPIDVYLNRAKQLQDQGKPVPYIPYRYTGTQEDSDTIHHSFETELYDIQIPNHRFTIHKDFIFYKNHYYFDLKVTFRRTTPNSFTIRYENEDDRKDQKIIDVNAGAFLFWYNGLGPVLPKLQETTYDNQYIYLNYMMPDGTLHYYYSKGSIYDSSTKKMIPSTQDHFRTPPKWMGLDNRYYLVAMLPDKTNQSNLLPMEQSWVYWSDFFSNEQPLMELSFGYSVAPIDLWEPRTMNMRIYLGPKMRHELATTYEESEDGIYPSLAPIQERASWFFISLTNWIAAGLEWLLFFLNSYIGNYGVTLIVITILLKVVMHPLTVQSMKSSKKMQTVQPKIQDLQERYKNDKVQLQKEMQQLYAREKINPLGGCLPLVLQMPIFYGLWLLFPFLSELRNSQFLWITDLSSPDTVLYLNFWPYQVNILPFIMTVTSYFQMQLTPTMTGGAAGQGMSMKMMKYLMPGMFLFIFYYMPSGMVLYWAVQNILQVLHQMYMNSHDDKKKKPAPYSAKVIDMPFTKGHSEDASSSKERKTTSRNKKDDAATSDEPKKKKKNWATMFQERYPGYNVPGQKQPLPKKRKKRKK